MTDQVHFCIQCGKGFNPLNPDVAICPKCGGPAPRASRESVYQPGQPVWTLPAPEEPGSSEKAPDAQSLWDRLEPKRTQAMPPPDAGRTFTSPGDAPDQWAPGDTILDLYEVKQRIETGGMAVVYQVHHKSWNIDLAVKTPRADQIDDQAGLETFTNEAEAWIDLGLHPNIVTCHYVRKLGTEGVPRVFAEWVGGGSLLEWISGGRLADLRAILDAAIQFAWGLAYAHEKGLVHRDVKPGNVLVTEQGILKVTDFGLANARGSYFTPGYASPEQVLGQASTLKTDIWSWGLSVLHMLAGERTWSDGSIAPDLLEDALQTGLSIPADLHKLLQECFRNDPAERPEDMLNIAERLADLYEVEAGDSYPRELPEAADLRAGSLNNRALSMLDLGQEIEAAKNWEMALETDESHPDSTFNYGVTRWRNALITDDELIDQLEFSLSSNPLNWQAYYNLGMAHVERGDIETAAASFRKFPEVTANDSLVMDALHEIKPLKPGAVCDRTTRVESHTSVSIGNRNTQVGTAGQVSLPAVWDIASGKRILRISPRLEELEAELPAIAFSQDGNYILEGGYSEIRLWDRQAIRKAEAEEDKRPYKFDTFRPLRALAISPDNHYGLSGNMEGTVAVYDLDAREEINYLPEHHGDVRFVGFSGDGKWGISGGDDGRIHVSAVATGQVIHQFTGPAVWSVAVSEDNRWIAAACRDHTVRIWDLESKICPRVLQGHKDEVRAVAVSPDSGWVLSGSADQTIRIWDLASGRCLRTLEKQSSTIHALFLLSQKKDQLEILSAAENGELKRWQIGELGVNPGSWSVSTPTSYTEAEALARTGKGRVEEIRTAIEAGDLEQARSSLVAAKNLPGFENDPDLLELIYELAPQIGRREKFIGAKTHLTLKEHISFVDQISVTDDGRFLIVDGRELVVWDLHENGFRSTVPGGAYTGTPPRPPVITPDSRYLVATSGGTWNPKPDLWLWDLEKGEKSRVLAHDQKVLDFQLHPSGGEIITLSYAEKEDEREIHIWDLQSGEPSGSLPCSNQARRILITDDGRYVLALQENVDVTDSEGITRRMSSLAVVSLFEEGERIIDGISLPFVKSPDPRHTAGRSSGLVVLDVEEGAPVAHLEGARFEHPRSEALKFTPDGSHLIAPIQGGLGVWDVEHGTMVVKLEAPDCESLMYTVLTEDGKWVLAAGSTGYEKSSIYLWHLESGELLDTLKVFTDVMSIALFQNDRFLACSGEEEIKIWELTWSYEFPEFTDWDEGARRYLDIFLARHITPPGPDGVSRERHHWTEAALQTFQGELGLRGYGWLRPGGVRRELEKMAAEGG